MVKEIIVNGVPIPVKKKDVEFQQEYLYVEDIPLQSIPKREKVEDDEEHGVVVIEVF